jgi:mono/diheme cytochrome c family protein
VTCFLRRAEIIRGVALVGIIIITGCSAPESPAVAYAQDPAAVARGRGLFVGTCGAYCHGLQSGNRDAPFLFDCEWKHGGRDEDLFRVINDGMPQTRMPSFADKMPDGDEDIWKVIAYVRTKSICP